MELLTAKQARTMADESEAAFDKLIKANEEKLKLTINGGVHCFWASYGNEHFELKMREHYTLRGFDCKNRSGYQFLVEF